jgi:hypothetical protein
MTDPQINAPPWFPAASLKAELVRLSMLGLPPDERDAVFSRLSNQLKSILPSIKSAELKPDSATIVPRRGILPTTVGADIGYEPAGNVSSGWANYFNRGEVLEVKGRSTTTKSPTLSVVYTHPFFGLPDYSQPVPFSRFVASSSVDVRQIADEVIETASIETSWLPKGRGLRHGVAISLIVNRITKNSPVVLAADPARYLKVAWKTEAPAAVPSLAGAIEAGILAGGGRPIPYVKLNGVSRLQVGWGMGLGAGGGLIIANRAVPFAEKFRIGGVPIAYGIEYEKFGTVVGGFASGSDGWISGVADFSTVVLPEYNLNAHFFLNAAVAVNRKSNSVLDFAPSVAKVASGGAGLTFAQGPVRIEMNVQAPYVVTQGLSFLRFQIGFSPL